MARALWDHTFKTIGDQNDLSEGCIREKLTQVAALRAALAAEAGQHVAADIIKPSLEACLEVCLRKFEPAQHVSGERYGENYNYAANAAMAIDEQVSQNYSSLEY
ncbi:hypothetical protein IFT43_20715 [Oxalobacteraceae sp. CFBP 13708]|nr:hypothetical protein [Oxalobacteraceae sp. CFBP 13708]